MSYILKCWSVLAVLMLTSALRVQGQLTKYHYWFDGDCENPVTVEGSLDAIDCSGLKIGLHQLHVYAEKDGEVSPPQSVWFLRGIIPEDGNVDLMVFIDGSYHSTTKANSSGVSMLDLDLLALEKGIHTLRLVPATTEYVSPGLWEVEFEAAGLAQSNNLTMAITDSRGSDVTDLVSIEWYRHDELIGTGSKISGVESGDTLRYRVVLPEALGTKYMDVSESEYIVSSERPIIEIALVPFDPVKLTGYVHTDEAAAGGVTIDILQYPNDRFTTRTSVVTAADGSFETTLMDVPTRLELSGEGYISTSRVIENLTAQDVLPLDIEILRESTGSIALELNYYAATSEGPVKQSVLTADGDINYTLVCDGVELTTGIYTGSSISLPEGLEEGSTLTVRLASANRLFDPVEASTVYEGLESTPLSISVVERGGIESLYSGESAPLNSVAYLYSADGRLKDSESYVDGVVFKGLDSGSYIIVSLVNDGSMGVPASIDDFSALGMKVGSDYLLNKIEVEQGCIKTISLNIIPSPDMAWAADITSQAIFTATKTTVTASEFVTATVNLNLSDDVIEKSVSGALTISLPDNCVFEPGSMMVNGKVTPVSVQDGRISVKLNKEDLSSRLRFCLTSLAGGDYNVGASLALNLGSEVVCPIEPLWYHVVDYDVYVPAKTSKPSISVMGAASPNGHVEIYAGTNLLGAADADATGVWSVVVDLNEPRNNSTYKIWALTTSPTGKTFATQPQNCSYNEKYLVPKKVTMVNTAHKAGVQTLIEENTVFYLDGDRNVSSRYYRYYPAYPDFTFLIDFERNDPDQLSSVLLNVFTENGNSITLPTEFDQSQRRWTTHYSFPKTDLPVNVSVDYSEHIDNVIEVFENPFSETLSEIDRAFMEYKSMEEDINKLIVRAEKDASLVDSVGIAIYRFLRRFEVSESQEQDPEATSYYDRMDNAATIEEAEKVVVEFEKYLEAQLVEQYGEEMAKEILQMSDAPVPLDEKISLDNNLNVYYHYTPGTQDQDGPNLGSWQVNTMDIDQVENGQLVASNTVTGETVTCDFRELVREMNTLKDTEGFLTNIGYGLLIPSVAGSLKYEKLTHHLIVRKSVLLKIAHKYAARGDQVKWNKFRIYWYGKSNEYFGKVSEVDLQIQKFNKLNNLNTGLAALQSIVTSGSAVAYQTFGLKSWVDFEDEMLREIYFSQCFGAQTEILRQVEESKKWSQWKRATLNISQIVGNAGISIASAAGAYATAGLSLIVGGVVSCVSDAIINILKNNLDLEDQNRQNEIRAALKNWSDCETFPGQRRYPRPPYPRNDGKPIEDPSGFVYEGVVSMPVEGVTSTIYFNESTEGDGTKWNAGDYGQINPQSTDAMGMYGWDVPRGNYRVVFEKEGYETVSTDWLPVPPPQLDVNVSLHKNTPAALKNAFAHKDEVLVEFDTYMDASTLTGDNLFVESEGNRLDAAIEHINPATGENPEKVLASKFRIVPVAPIATDRVTLVVKPEAETYAGVGMDGEARQVLAVEDAITELVAPEVFEVAYGDEAKMRIHALPVDAVAGKSLRVFPSSSIIIGVTDDEVMFDEHGYATVGVEGLLPGNAALTFSVDGYEDPVTTRVIVGTSTTPDVEAPVPSISSGSVVSRGTVLKLYSNIPGAFIYYTLDGSCPCDPTSTREIFDVNQPIVLNRNVTVKAMAVTDTGESEIVSFSYRIRSYISGIVGADNDEVKVYPIPVADKLHIDVPWSGECGVLIYSSTGSLVKKDVISGPRAVVDVSALAPGIYIMTLRGDETKSFRIIKQ